MHSARRCGHRYRRLLSLYREEILFSLKQALESYDHYQSQLQACNKEIETITQKFDDKGNGEKIEVKKESKKKQSGV